jgi:hypothetical protein
MKSMKFEKILATTTLTGTLLAGCSAPDQPPTPSPSPTPSVSESSTPLLFDSTPETNYNFADCYRDTNNWAVDITSDPGKKPSVETAEHTVGVIKKEQGPAVTLLAGATIRSLGDFSFRVATSADIPGDSTVVNVKEETYSRVLRAGEGFDAVFSLRLGRDGSSYAQIDCLPEFDFHGDKTPIPLLPSTPPSQSPGIPAGRDNDTVDA